MSIEWGVLGIEPTKDKDVITKAYRSELKKTNPEDNPEGFKELREVYEAALEYAETDDSKEAENKTDVDLWVDSLAEIYDDFQRRIDPECWKQAFADKVCESIESSEKAFEGLMKFLMEHYYLPKAVWQELDARFELMARHDELCEKWPADFIDYVVVPGITYPENLPYNMFEPGVSGTDCDKLRRFYLDALSAQGAEALELLDKAEKLSESHPYVKGFRNSIIIAGGEGDVAAAIAAQEELYKKYPQDLYFRNAYVRALITGGEYDKCETICKDIMEAGAADISICNSLAEVLTKKGQLEDAFELINHEMKIREYSVEVMAALHKIREEICDKILEDISIVKREDDNDYYKKLSWYAMSASGYRYDKAREFAEHLDPDSMNPFDYNNIMSAIHTAFKEYDKVTECNEKLIDHIKAHMEGDDEETLQMRNRLPYMYCSQLETFALLGNREEADRYMSIALSEYPGNQMVQICVIKTRLKLKDYEGAREVAEMMLKADKLDFFGWYFLGHAAYGMWDDKTAFEAGYRIVEMAPNQPMGYALQLRVLARNNAYDRIKETLEYISENEIEDNGEFKFFEIVLLEREDKDKAFAEYLALLEDAQKDPEFDEDSFFVEDIRAKLLDLFDDRIKELRRQNKGQEAASECERCCRLLDIPLEESPALAIYKQFGMWDEADALLEEAGTRDEIEARYQRIQVEMAKGNLDKAREIYNSLNAQNILPETNIHHSFFLQLDGNLKGEKEFWKKSAKTNKERGGDVFNDYVHLSVVCRRLGDWLGARKYAKLAIDILEKRLEEGEYYEPLFRTQMACAYAALGNFEVAEAEIAKARKCKLCGHCEYSECKDSYIFEMLTEMLKGNYDRAHEIAQMGMKRWPDEVDFCCYDGQMKSLGVIGK